MASSSSDVCPIDPSSSLVTSLETSSYGDPFETTLVIERFHRVSPRFGHSSNLQADLLEGTNEQQEDYLKGLLAASTAIFVLVLLWVSILLLSNWFCRSKATIWTGKRQLIQKPEQPTVSKPKRKGMPFQQGGVAGGGETSSKFLTSALKSKLQAARDKKRRIEAQHGTKKKYSKKNHQKLDDGSLEDHFAEIEISETATEDQSQNNQTPLESALTSSARHHQDPIYRSPGTAPTTSIQSHDGEDGTATIGNGTHGETTTQHTGGTSGEVSRGTVETNTSASTGAIAAEIEEEKARRKAWDEYHQAVDDYRRQCDAQALRIYRVRLVLVTCFVGIIVSVVLFMTMGMYGVTTPNSNGGLAQSVIYIKGGIQQFSENCELAINLINDFEAKQYQTSNSTAKFIVEVNGEFLWRCMWGIVLVLGCTNFIPIPPI